jgi:hypothetical protein
MRCEEDCRRLREHWDELRGLGITHLAVFGSVARGEARDDSDVDLLVDFDREIGLFHLSRVQHRLEELLHADHVDLVMRSCVARDAQERVFEESIDVA